MAASAPRADGAAAAAAALVVFGVFLMALLVGLAGCGGGGVGSSTTGTATGGTSTDGTATGGTSSGDTAAGGGEEPTEIVLMTHDSFAVSDDVLAAFTRETGIRVRVLTSGDAGIMLNQAILTRDNPLADVLYGVDNTFLSRALDAGLFEPYAPPALDRVPDALELDPEHRVTPIDFGDICLNYDKEYFASSGLAVPTSLADLVKPEYRGLLVVENPATSSPGLAFLIATVAEFGEGGEYTWQDFWVGLAANDVLVASGWEEAYYSDFSGGAGEGDRPLVVSYASSPPAEVIFSEQPLTEAPTGVIVDGAFRQIEFAGILAGTKAPRGARLFLDFMLSLEFQEDMPLNMFVFPANSDAALPPEFLEFTHVPPNPVSVDPWAIESDRERWIEEWTAIVLS
ncbi:MAG TPA: thiamine ABC transporter substrate-binding protein [Thermoleophilia bacterium]|nr:thiamine ABC transporter substrate-binding protein [Thermoleophilia bacterium]